MAQREESPLKGRGRTVEYLVWRSCERWNLRPWEWEDLSPDRRRKLLSYEWIRDEEEAR